MGGMNLVSHSAARRETPHEPLCLDPTQVQTALEPSLIAGEPAARSLEVPPAAISPFPVALEPTQLQIIEASTQPKELPEFLGIKGRSHNYAYCLDHMPFVSAGYLHSLCSPTSP